MSTGRRDFLGSLALGTLGAASLDLLGPPELPAQQAAGLWDLSWTRRLKGKYRAIFDIPVIEDGYGVWRAVIWRKQYSQVFGVPENSLATVVNLRHDAISLALNNEFWEKYAIGKQWNVLDPATLRPTSRNPVIERTGRDALPDDYADFTLESLMASGGIVLGCALALRDCASVVSKADGVEYEEASRRIRDMIVPGVIMQPSGIFAAVLAQDNGCRFVRAS